MRANVGDEPIVEKREAGQVGRVGTIVALKGSDALKDAATSLGLAGPAGNPDLRP